MPISSDDGCFKDVERLPPAEIQWPDLDGGVFAGLYGATFEERRKRCRHAIYCSGAGDPSVTPVVALDDVAAGVQAAEHLLNCGLEAFAFHGFVPDFKTASNRLAGFRHTVESKGFSCAVSPFGLPAREERVSHVHRPAIQAWLRDLPKPIGILALDDTHASDLAEACLEADIGVPDHVAIVGINNDDLLCESAWPPLTSVEADYSRMGYVAAALLDRLLKGATLSPSERLVLLPPLGVVHRQSTNTLAVKDPNLADAVRFIREHACDPCTVGDLLRAVPVGRRWLERQFMAQLGRTPHDEISRVRIESAQRLLQRSDLGMLEIARRCGFAELKSFYLAFGRLTSTTPAAYRRSSRTER